MEGRGATQPSDRDCPACGSPGLRPFYSLSAIPTHSNLLSASAGVAAADRGGRLELAVCAACGFITNLVFEPATQEHTTGYEASQACSPTFGGFTRELARSWVERHRLEGRSILEIGCGQGEFTAMLAEASGGRCVGLDPVVDPARVPRPSRGQARVVAERFGERHRDLVGDFVCCRHTLEHIAEPLSFLAMLRRVIGDRREVVVAFEVPDTRRVLDEGAFWDLYYEHCSYFTAGSLARLFRRCGLHPSSLRLEYGGQYLIVEGSPAPGPSEPLALEEGVTATLEAVDRFVDVCSAKLRAWTGVLREAAERRESVVLWGAGSKAVGFLTTLGIGREVDCVVDINPPKQGTYLPGSAHPIVAPAALAGRRPDTVIVMNPVYVPEISRDLAALGLEPRILPLV